MSGSTKVVSVQYVRRTWTYYCSECGKKCETTKRTDRPYAPDACKTCAIERQRALVRGLFCRRTRAT